MESLESKGGSSNGGISGFFGYVFNFDSETKSELMNITQYALMALIPIVFLNKIMQKFIPEAPHEVLLVLDGSTGQNAFIQAQEFTKVTEVTSLAITKLDGTAKGGVVIGISDQFKIPVKYIGVGEKISDLQVFNKTAFVESIFAKK
jgi:signal recognition particle GTPase